MLSLSHVEKAFLGRDAAISAEKQGDFQTARRYYLFGAEAAKSSEHADMRAMYLGLRADAALAAWHDGDRAVCLVDLVDVLAEIEELDPKSSLRAAHSLQGDDNVHISYLPIGTILAVMPWNFPIWQVIRAAAPIMLSGNGFLLKHATNVMGSALALQEVYEAAGFPKGLFANLTTDNESVARVIEDRRIAAVTVTGSVGAGSAIASTAGKYLKKSLLELGGSDAFIVLTNADIDRAVAAGIKARFQNAGQVCLAAKRFILEKPIAEEFTRKFIAATRQLKAGDPFDPDTSVGPMARSDLRDELHRQVERTIEAGASLLLGGQKIEGPGNFYQPTVLADVTPGMAAFDEETFGPVAAITIADDTEDAIRLANFSEYGLSSNLWTNDLEMANRVASRLETGGVFINGFSASSACIPVGGVKSSGYGRELSHFGLREFTNAQAVWAKSVV